MRSTLPFDFWITKIVTLLTWGLIGMLLLSGMGCTGAGQGEGNETVVPRFSVLVFSKTDTAGYRHASIPDGIQAIRDLGKRHYFEVTATEEASVFTADSLQSYDAVVFLNTSGDVLDAGEQRAFETYVRSGGGFVGVHGAAATEYDWSWYGGLVGAFFDDHPDVQEAEVNVVNDSDPSTRHLPASWSWADEWYNFRSDPSDSVEVLLELDEESYEGGSMGESHPIAWKQSYDGGRSFYTGLGHTNEAYETPRFLRHLYEGIEWAAGDLDTFVEPGFPFITTTVDAGGLAPFMPKRNVAVRGLALQLGNGAYASFDPDLLRMSAGWTGAFVSMSTMAQVSYEQPFNKSNDIPRVLGDPVFGTGLYPGWTAGTPQFEDPRPMGPNPEDPGRGPLSEERGQWKGVHVVGDELVLSYSIQGTDVREAPSSVRVGGKVGITRTFQMGETTRPLSLVAAEVRGGVDVRGDSNTVVVSHGGAGDSVTAVGAVGLPEDAELRVADDRYVTLRLAGGMTEARFKVVLWTGREAALSSFRTMMRGPVEMPDVEADAPEQWSRAVRTRGRVAPDTSAFVTDELSLPAPNPWNRNVRAADIDFFEDGRAAVVTFSGDVWLVSGITQELKQIRWERFASGLYEPLSLSIVDGKIYVYGRGGIVRLHDRNGDGEADFYESFSDEIIQSMETREWPLDMVARPEGGFLVSMGAALNAGPRTEASREIMPGFRIGSKHGGTVTKVSAEGDSVAVYADGFREPYLGTYPASRFLTASDQQGNFVPSTPVYAVGEGNFYGVPATTSRTDRVPEIEKPITWIPHQVDPSGASRIWVDSDQMGPLNNKLVHFSYSRPGLFRVYTDTTRRPWQGGVIPIGGTYNAPTIKGQTHPRDGQLYVAGFQVFGSRAEKVSGLRRLRYTGKAGKIPASVQAGKQGVLLRFGQALDTTAANRTKYAVRRWNYRRTEQYGSGRYMLDGSAGTESLPVAAAHLSDDRRAVLLVLPDMRPVQQIEVDYSINGAQGTSLEGPLYLTLNEARPLDLEKSGFGDVGWKKDLKNAPDPLANASATDKSAEKVVVSAKRGRHIYQEIGCVTCHSIDGADGGKIGPSFKGLFGSERALKSGEAVTADEAYLEQSIRSPSSQVVEGYPANMPTYKGILSDSEIEALIQFVKSLSERGATAEGE
jgi:type 1 glutamine amidotransferase/cytochrome c2/glucose/arabinose dehydrogenase